MLHARSIIVIENRLILMDLLHTILQVITGSSFGVNKVLVSFVLETASLHHLDAEVDIPPFSFNLHRISQIYICRTR